MSPDEGKYAAPLDKRDLLERIGGDENFIGELIDLYRTEFRQKFPVLKEAVAAGDAETVYKTAHNLKGASANVSMPGLQKAFFDLEKAGREGSLAEAPALLARIELEYLRLESYLNQV